MGVNKNLNTDSDQELIEALERRVKAVEAHARVHVPEALLALATAIRLLKEMKK